MNKEISTSTLQRFPVYLNYLRSLPADKGRGYISSGAIAKALSLGEVLVRKDLAYTSCVGKPKVGYVVDELKAALEDYLCCNNKKSAVIVGVGGLGSALLSYNGFIHYGIEITAGFDSDETKVGKQIAGKSVYAMDKMAEVCSLHNSTLAIIAVPVSAAQGVAEQLIAAGIKAILNFAPVQLRVDDKIKVINMDVAANLSVLATMI
jgi:redox-sensing transcriptional repressor